MKEEDDTGLWSSSCNKEFSALKDQPYPPLSYNHTAIVICEVPPFCSLPRSSPPPLAPPTLGNWDEHTLQTCVRIHTDNIVTKRRTDIHNTSLLFITYTKQWSIKILAHGNQLQWNLRKQTPPITETSTMRTRVHSPELYSIILQLL